MVEDGLTEEEGGVTSQEEEFDEIELEQVWDEEEEGDDGSMSPTDAIKGVGEDPICYHCGVALVDPPMRLNTDDVMVSPKLSIPLHCEVCIRGIHSQCHISLGGALPTQEESFVCFHCRTSQHGKYAMKAADRARVLVGPAHQVPMIPDMFYAIPEGERRHNVARKKYEQVWCADAGKAVIGDDMKVHVYLQKACQNWPDRLRVNSTGGSLAPGSVRRLYVSRAAAASYNTGSVLNHYWCPFSPEYALSVLHRCSYNIDNALAAIQSPLLRDCFAQVCNPPTKPYYNKWKPKDRRWRMMKIPFPPSRIEAPDVGGGYNTYEIGEGGHRLRSRRYLNYNY